MPDKKLENVPLSKREREYISRIAQRDGITEDEAATNLFKAELAKRARKRAGRVTPLRKR